LAFTFIVSENLSYCLKMIIIYFVCSVNTLLRLFRCFLENFLENCQDFCWIKALKVVAEAALWQFMMEYMTALDLITGLNIYRGVC